MQYINGDVTIELEIKDRILIEERIALINQTVKQSYLDNVLNPMLLEVSFLVNMVMSYTNIEIEGDMKVLDFYDAIEQQGVLKWFCESMVKHPDWEYMQNSLHECAEARGNYENSFTGIITTLLTGISDVIEKNADTLKGIDFSKLSEILPVAQALGYGYPPLLPEAQE